MLRRDEFEAILATKGILVIDGGLATELESRGHDLNHALWSARLLKENPQSIENVHLAFLNAGADLIMTASYQASVTGFTEQLGISERESISLIKKSVELAQSAIDRYGRCAEQHEHHCLVAGSVGPYGAYLANGSEYRGDYHRSEDHFQTFHRPRISALVEAGVDVLAIETMPNISEIKAVLNLLRNEYTSSISFLSCTLRDPSHISDGTGIEELLRLVNTYRDQVVAVGINCVPPELVTPALQELKRYTDLPLLCYPNSGESWDATSKTWSNSRSEDGDFDEQFRAWNATGARLIGGCCRTGPDHIRAAAQACERFQ